LFYRNSDELLLECTEIVLNETSISEGTLRIREQEITLPDGSVRELKSISALSGMATRAVIPREAMGMGDPHLLGMIGAFIGGTGVLFTVCASAFLALTAAILGRIGFGKPLPFGPFLALGALVWIFGGWKLWAAYLQWIGL
jgi:leader peptidase (prepilin peptidase)/N-methyltransferase